MNTKMLKVINTSVQSRYLVPAIQHTLLEYICILWKLHTPIFSFARQSL
jgi:hypothetical protein